MWNLLIVDDDFSTRKLLNRTLHRRSMVDHAVNGREALAAYSMSQEHQDPYHAILLDISMPEMDGIEALKEIRRQEAFHGVPEGFGVPIVMISGRTDREAEAREAGCNDFMEKPISPSDLLKKLREIIQT